MRATYMGIEVYVTPQGFEILETGLKFNTLEELRAFITKGEILWKTDINKQ